MSVRCALAWLVYTSWAATTVLAQAADAPTGSAYLRTLTIADPPFGQRQYDGLPWDGVRIQRWRREQPETDWLMVWIDLRTPGLGYRVTPIHYKTGPGGWPIQAAHAQTTLDFLQRSADPPRVDLAVNTVAYFPFPAFNGTSAFLSEPVWQGDDRRQDPQPGAPMLGLLPGRALIDDVTAMRIAEPICAFGSFREDNVPESHRNAVRDGQVISTGTDAHGRTVAGVSADGRILTLLVADGYNPGVSLGLGLHDSARLLLAAGAHRAVFLDGGGSSTLVGRDADGRAVVLNRPAGLQKTPGTLRYVAVNLGFTDLRRSTDALPAIEGWEAPFYVTAWEDLITWGRVHPRRAVALGVGLAILGVCSVVGLWFRRRWRRQNAAKPS